MDDLAARVLGAISEAEAAEVHYEGCAVIRHGHAEVTCDCTATAALRRRCAADRKIVAEVRGLSDGFLRGDLAAALGDCVLALLAEGYGIEVP